MLDVNELSYAAIITITLPGTAERATVTLTLLPHDKVTTSTGRVKALRDCTLAELQEYAEALESDAWAAYREQRLGELATAEDAHVKITILNETGQPRNATADEWLSHVVVFPEAGLVPAGEPETPADKETTEAEPVEAVPDPAEVDVAVADEELPAEETPAAEPAPEPKPVREKTLETPEVPPEVEATEAAPEETATEEAAAVTEEEVTEEAPVEEAAVEPVTEEAPAVPFRIAGLRRPVGHSTPAAVDILINEPAFRDAQAHALSSMDREVAGVLIGPRPEKQPDGRYVVHISDIIIAKHTKMQGASVTYTPESWRYIHDRLAERYPNEEAVIVGWYHTHPGFGIFLSGMDLFIHQNFFTQLWHVALVLDPVAAKSGFFCWDRSKTAVSRYEFPWPEWAARSW